LPARFAGCWKVSILRTVNRVIDGAKRFVTAGTDFECAGFHLLTYTDVSRHRCSKGAEYKSIPQAGDFLWKRSVQVVDARPSPTQERNVSPEHGIEKMQDIWPQVSNKPANAHPSAKITGPAGANKVNRNA
jgi:hypothetical protein